MQIQILESELNFDQPIIRRYQCEWCHGPSDQAGLCDKCNQEVADLAKISTPTTLFVKQEPCTVCGTLTNTTICQRCSESVEEEKPYIFYTLEE